MNSQSKATQGLAANLIARILWGVAAYYFALAKTHDAFALFFQRVLWAFVFCALLFKVTRTPFSKLRACCATPRQAVISVGAASIISCNWFVVLWSVKQGRTIDVSLGFYAAPIVSVFLGLAVLREGLTWWTGAAVCACFAGVATVFAGDPRGFVWSILYIAASSGVYALIRKKYPVHPLAGNLFETGVALLVTTAIGLVSGCDLSVMGTAQDGWVYSLGLGVVTTVPMFFYLFSLDKISLSLNGYLQYLSPTVVFLLAWLVLREPVPSYKVTGFSLVWSAIAIYVLGGVWTVRRRVSLQQASAANS